MGAFFLMHRAAGGDPERLSQRLEASFRRQGFTAATSIEGSHWRAVCYAPLAVAETTACVDGAGDRAFCAGTLFYRGLSKSAALARLLGDHKNRAIDEAMLCGSFAALLVAGATATVLTDRIGTFHLYATPDHRILSTSFLALAESLPKRTIHENAVYDYVLQGSPKGGETVVEQIGLFPDGALGHFDGAVRLADRPDPAVPPQRYRGLDHAAGHCVDLLRERFRHLATQWPAIDTALSGGYDSRLLLALAWDAKLRPRVHVYGRDGDADVRCAKAIAAAEGFPLDHLDKSSVPLPEPEDYAELVRANYLAFDGYPTDGIFDNGTDLATRRRRVAGGALMLNGGGGEIFRNFFYLPDRALSALEIVWTFYCQFDARVCSDRFDERRYLDGLAAKIAARVGGRRERLSRREVEAIYPLFRCTYWAGRNNSVNNRLGHAWTPYLDMPLIHAALDIPLAYKNLGRLEGRMIEMLSPRLAAYPSAYGHSFDHPPSVRERLLGLIGRWRPPLVRRHTYRLRRRRQPPWTGALERRRLGHAMAPDFPFMSGFFHLARIDDRSQLARICTLEYMFQQLDPAAGGPPPRPARPPGPPPAPPRRRPAPPPGAPGRPA